jgi:peroxiredoxin
MDTLDTLGCGRPLEIGVPAPDFTLTMVETDRPVSLAEYRGKTPLLLGLYRGLYCAFCRRAVARLGRAGDRLRPLGIETLAVIGTTLDKRRPSLIVFPPGLARLLTRLSRIGSAL